MDGLLSSSESGIKSDDVRRVVKGIMQDDKIECDRVLDDGDVKEGSVEMNGVFVALGTCNGMITVQSQTPNSSSAFC